MDELAYMMNNYGHNNINNNNNGSPSTPFPPLSYTPHTLSFSLSPPSMMSDRQHMYLDLHAAHTQLWHRVLTPNTSITISTLKHHQNAPLRSALFSSLAPPSAWGELALFYLRAHTHRDRVSRGEGSGRVVQSYDVHDQQLSVFTPSTHIQMSPYYYTRADTTATNNTNNTTSSSVCAVPVPG